MQRRKFLARVGLALTGGLTVSACGSSSDHSLAGAAAEETALEHASATPESWREVRMQFNLATNKIHLGAMLVSSHPQPVRAAIQKYRRRLNASPVLYLKEQNVKRKKAARDAAGAYLGARADDIALTDSTTMGLGLVYSGLHLRPDQEALTTDHAYYSTDASLRLAASRTGASVHRMQLYDEPAQAAAEQITDRIARAIKPSTRVLALTWVSSNNGVKLPLQQISEVVAQANAGRAEEDRVLVGVDGVHGFGIENVIVDELGCDFFMAGCHKWLFGPRGTGIVWARPDAWAQTTPTIPSFMADDLWTAWALEEEPAGPTTAVRMSPGGFKPFEHQWAMAEAFQFHRQVGKTRIAERTHALNRQLKEGLDTMPHVTLHTPLAESLSAGIVTFDVEGYSPWDVVNFLKEHNIVATTTPYGDSHARLTPCIYNTTREIDTTLAAVQAMR